MCIDKIHVHMEKQPVLKSKVLNEASRLIELYEKEKGSKELNPLLNLLRDIKASLLKKNGTFVSPKEEKRIADIRAKLAQMSE